MYPIILSIFLFLLFNTALMADLFLGCTNKQTYHRIANCTAIINHELYRSEDNGTIHIDSIDTKGLAITVKSIGYRKKTFMIDSNSTRHQQVLLEPFHAKGLYLSFWGANRHSKTFKRMKRIIALTPINTMVIDVKNEYGLTSFKTSSLTALKNFSHKNRTIVDMKQYVKQLHAQGIYLIARIVVFKDELQAKSSPEVAMRTAQGEVWRNRDNLAWVDPFVEQTHQYVIEIARSAAKMGFDEINFDYIRFPATSKICTSKDNTEKNRIAAIEKFLKEARTTLEPYGVFISVDTFGQICWNSDDVRIGQTIRSLSKYSDYLCPMLYPSGFKSGVLGFKHPSSHPYEMVHQSIEQMKKEISAKRIRPWLQAFRDYAHTKQKYGYSAIQAQIRACDDSNTSGWLFWNPSSRYNIAHYSSKAQPVQPSKNHFIIYH